MIEGPGLPFYDVADSLFCSRGELQIKGRSGDDRNQRKRRKLGAIS